MIKGFSVGISNITNELYLTVYPTQGEAIFIEGEEVNEVAKHIEAIKKVAEAAKPTAEKERDSLIEIINEKTTDEEKVSLIDIYPNWEIGKKYNGPTEVNTTIDVISISIQSYVQHMGKLYKCTQSHTSQIDWAPDVAVSLWAEVGVTNPDTGLEELKPSTTNLYATGDIGTWNGRVYESLYPNNGNPPLFEDGSPSGWWKDLGTIEEYLNGR